MTARTGAIGRPIVTMRFNDYHKQISAALQLDEEWSRRYRTFMIRCYTRSLSANACLTLLRLEPDIVNLLAQRAKEDAARAVPVEAA